MLDPELYDFVEPDERRDALALCRAYFTRDRKQKEAQEKAHWEEFERQQRVKKEREDTIKMYVAAGFGKLSHMTSICPDLLASFEGVLVLAGFVVIWVIRKKQKDGFNDGGNPNGVIVGLDSGEMRPATSAPNSVVTGAVQRSTASVNARL